MIKNWNKNLVVATALAAGLSFVAIAPADARHRGHHGGGNTGAYVALGLGVAALGGALAYSATRDYPPPAYYYAPPPPPAYYYAPAPTYYYAPAPPVSYYYADPYYDRMSP